MNKEEIYDSQISPLMTQIIAIAQQNGISMIASFAIQHDGEGPDGEDCSQLTCSTVLPDETGEVDQRFARAFSVIRKSAQQAAQSLMITTENGNGTKTLTAFI